MYGIYNKAFYLFCGIVASGILYSAGTIAETTIYFEDGSVVYTEDSVYSSPNTVYKLQELTDGTIKFVPIAPLDGEVIVDDEVVDDTPLQCWPWAGVGAPEGYSTEACVVEEEEVEECTPDGLTFGGGC